MKICLIGSSRFRDKYDEMNKRLSLGGHVVYSIAMVSTGNTLEPDQKETLDLVHLRKIQESEAVVLITDEDGYIGESTRREIKWATMLSKRKLTDCLKLVDDWDSPWGDVTFI
jgi:hypothetical protein